jgi:hypothetical protein
MISSIRVENACHWRTTGVRQWKRNEDYGGFSMARYAIVIEMINTESDKQRISRKCNATAALGYI